MMKRLWILLLILSLVLSMAACAKTDTATTDQQEPQATADQATEAATQATESVKATQAAAPPSNRGACANRRARADGKEILL